jgi:hypothetical protein
MKYSMENGGPFDRTSEHSAKLAERGQLDALKLTHEYGGRWDELTVHAAILGDKTEVLTYLLEQGCPATAESALTAVLHGRYACLQLLHQHKVPWDGRACDMAIKTNNLDILKYLHENGCPWGARKANNIALKHWNKELIEYCYSHGCAVNHNPSILADMALHGRLALLTLSHTHGAPWDERTPAAAAKGGHLDCLAYAHEHGCPWDYRTTTNALQQGHLDCLQYACEHGCAVAAKSYLAAEGELRDTPIGQYLRAFKESSRKDTV